MILVFGGVYQGKLTYATERLEAKENDVFRCSEHDTNLPNGYPIVYELDKWILALVKAGMDTDLVIKNFIRENSNACVIANDISSGVVPMDPEMRKWREAVGRALAEIARQSDEVVRMFCGIPTVLKK